MQLLDNELARRVDGQVRLRPGPLRVRWTIADLAAADGNDVRCAFACSVRALPDRTERQMLAEVLLHDRPAAAEADVAAHFAPALRAAAARVAGEAQAADLLEEAGKSRLAEALAAAARQVAFSCGVETLPPFQVETESPSLRQQRLRSMQRAAAEQHAAGQIEHLARAGELLKQFQAIRDASPDLSAGHVLQRVSPADRGAILQTLLLASTRERATQDLWAVAGPHLARIDFSHPTPQPQLMELPPALGPLRSVQPADVNGRAVLLVGARGGFFLVPRDDLGAVETYADPGTTSPLGFNRVVYFGRGLGFVASHAEAGIVRWGEGNFAGPIDAYRTAEHFATATGNATSAASIATRGVAATTAFSAGAVSMGAVSMGGASGGAAAGPRNLHVLRAGRVAFSVGNQIYVMNDDGDEMTAAAGASAADVVAIVPAERELILVHEDGTIGTMDRATDAITTRERAPGG